MNSTKDIIIQLKKVREEKELSFNDIIKLVEEKGEYTSKSTLSRLFAEGSEEYQNTRCRYSTFLGPE